MASVNPVEFPRHGVIVFVEIQEHKNESRPRSLVYEAPSKWMGNGLRIACTMLVTLFIAASAARPAAPRHIEVTAKRYSFEPAEITVKKGEAVELEVTSADVPHGLRIRELKIDLRVSKGKNADAVFTPQTTGTFVGHCSVFCGSGHGQMTFTIHVVG